MQLRQAELDLGVALKVVQPKAEEVRNQDVAWKIAVGQSVEIVRGLGKRAVEALPGALVLDKKYTLPEAVDAALFDLAIGAGQRDLLLEDRDAPSVDPEDAEEAVPEALSLGALRTFALPFAGERK